MNKQKKLKELETRLKYYEDKLADRMLGYRGVVHESAASEIRHSEVMVLKDIVRSLKEEIEKLKKEK